MAPEESYIDDTFPVLAPKKEAPKEEPVENSSPVKASASGAGRGTPSTSKSSKGKRKGNGEESKTTNGAPLKKVKTENCIFGSAPPSGPVTEEEIRAVLAQKSLMTTQDLVAKFKSRLKSKEDKGAFAAILRRISKIQKTNEANYVVMRDR
ncbi:hypothetical protein BUALT_Bualt05G0132800 [Buddleja alternifolia]|uniref:Transcription initiation factor IIF subunit alpha n=1 Tax=Buddleja alternifolia TaxID=168488 RepID=A0AAV6XQL3_9LAMI|nr:hypothetical protein BUALT_Bualt05G0132800 [Buddleja alternifolia]